MKMRRSFVLLLLPAVSACGLFPSAAERAVQKSPNFRAGYSDGCAAASTTGANYREGAYRDEALYKTSAAYRAGWGNGFSICRTEATGAAPGSPMNNSALNPTPGGH
jgi:hypothetical protein